LDAADGDHALRKFLERAKSGKLKGVEIRKSDPGTSDGRYLDSLREIAADPALSRKRKCDLLAVAQKKDRRHFGERACLHTIDHLLSTDQGQGDPIFFLSDDRDALNQCKEHFGHQVGCLNTKGLVGGFTENGLFEHVQMKPGLVHDMTKAIVSDRASLGGKDKGHGDLALIDNSQSWREGNDRKFQKLMDVLASNLGVGAHGNGSTRKEMIPTAGASRAAKFRERWGNSYAQGIRRSGDFPGEDGGSPALS